MHNVLAFRYPVRVLKCVPLHPIQNRSRYAYWKVRIPRCLATILVAMAIASRYKYLKTDEVMLFFFNFKAGMYERFYSYFDPQVIVGSVKSFCDERDTIITVHERELQQKRNEENEPKRQRYTK